MQQWKYGYTIRTGERHLRTGAACQDSVFALEDEKCIVMALCDGIGSLSLSGRAAQLAAAAACHILRKCADINFYHHAEVPNGMMKDLLESVDRFVTGKFCEEGADRSQGDCTLAFVFVSKLFDFGFAGSLGDSAVCLIRKSGNTCLTESNANLESTASLRAALCSTPSDASISISPSNSLISAVSGRQAGSMPAGKASDVNTFKPPSRHR